MNYSAMQLYGMFSLLLMTLCSYLLHFVYVYDVNSIHICTYVAISWIRIFDLKNDTPIHHILRPY